MLTRIQALWGALLFGLIAFWGGCLQEPEQSHYVKIQLADSLFSGDTVSVLMVARSTSKIIDTLYTGTLDDSAQIERCPAPHYQNEEFEIRIEYFRRGTLFRWIVIPSERKSGGDGGKMVIRYTDSIAPVILLKGRQEDSVAVHSRWVDSGAKCSDIVRSHKETVTLLLPIKISGDVDTSQIGIYTLIYSCKDEAGNKAIDVKRTITVWEADTTKDSDTLQSIPRISLSGPSVDSVTLGQSWRDSGATCSDTLKIGDSTIVRQLPIQVKGVVDSQTVGEYRLAYSCSNKSGIDSAFRQVKVWQIPIPAVVDTFFTSHDALFEMPTSNVSDNGYTPIIGLGPSWFTQANVHDFDLSTVTPTQVKRARLQMLTWAWPMVWNAGVVELKIRIRAVKGGWTEGTGNWYWHDGGYRNGGATIMANYGIPDSIKAKSTNPNTKTGINAADSVLFRPNALDSVGEYTVSAQFPNHPNKEMPLPENLVLLEVDISGFIKRFDPSTFHGFFIQVNGMPAGYSVAVPSKEVLDGKIAPRIVIEH